MESREQATERLLRQNEEAFDELKKKWGESMMLEVCEHMAQVVSRLAVAMGVEDNERRIKTRDRILEDSAAWMDSRISELRCRQKDGGEVDGNT